MRRNAVEMLTTHEMHDKAFPRISFWFMVLFKIATHIYELVT